MRWWVKQPRGVGRVSHADPEPSLGHARRDASLGTRGDWQAASRPLTRRWTAPILRSETPIADPAGAADPMATIRWP